MKEMPFCPTCLLYKACAGLMYTGENPLTCSIIVWALGRLAGVSPALGLCHSGLLKAGMPKRFNLDHCCGKLQYISKHVVV